VDLLGHLGYKLQLYLPTLLAIILRLLATACEAITAANNATLNPPHPAPSTVEDLLGHLGHKLQLFLPTLLAITLHLLATACEAINVSIAATAAAAAAAVAVAVVDGGEQIVEAPGGGVKKEGKESEAGQFERAREVRVSCLKLLAQVWSRSVLDQWWIRFRIQNPDTSFVISISISISISIITVWFASSASSSSCRCGPD
jgi:hypothetical protein